MEVLNSPGMLITVGDRVTETAHNLGRTPDVQVVDRLECREKRAAPLVPYREELRARNPAGTVTSQAMTAVRRAMKAKKPVRVLIDGEEDLLVIPAVEAAPMGSTILYGQPGAGIVVVGVNERAKASVQEILTRMRRAG